MTTTRFRFRPATVAKAGVLAATIALTVQAGESKAQPFPGDPGFALAAPQTCFFAQLTSGTCNPLIGDKQFSNLTFTDFAPVDGDSVAFRQTAPTAFSIQYNFNPARSFPNASGTFGYTITIIPPFADAGFRFVTAQANLTGGTIGGGTVQTVASSTALVAGAAISNSGPGANFAFKPDVTQAIFSQTFLASGGSNPTADIESFGLRFTQNREFRVNSVPGPLPILGAGAAFGLSRKLRRRIKQVA